MINRIPSFAKRGIGYQEQLIEALQARDGDDAFAVMQAHMRAAQRIMLSQEAEVTRRFLTAEVS